MEEVDDELIPVVQAIGMTRWEVAQNLRVGLSTLTRWLSRHRDREMDEPHRLPPEKDAAAELKRPRRENEILRQERDGVERANSFLQGGGPAKSGS